MKKVLERKIQIKGRMEVKLEQLVQEKEQQNKYQQEKQQCFERKSYLGISCL